MKAFKCAFYMMIGAGVALLYKTYEDEIMCACNKMVNKEKKMILDGLKMK